MMLSQEQIDTFHRDGVLVLHNFYDLEKDIEPIQKSIYRIIGLLIKKYNLPIKQQPFARATFDSAYLELIAHDRKIGGEVYDAVKQIPAFIRLCADERHETLVGQIRNVDLIGFSSGGQGIRINNPQEAKYLADWHQEYPFQMRSIDGVGFWTPLVSVDESLGPVHFCLGSHRDGIARVKRNNTAVYELEIVDKENLAKRYRVAAPLTKPGDLVILDFLTLHVSGENKGERTLWSLQFRYFNFKDPTGLKISWRGPSARGEEFCKFHPEYLAE